MKSEKIKFNGNHIKLYIDKNDSVCEVMNCVVTSWKKKGVPAEVKEERNSYFFNLVKGNPTKIAINRIIARLELEN